MLIKTTIANEQSLCYTTVLKGVIATWIKTIKIELNRICAMVTDMRPAAGAAVSLKHIFGA